MLESPYAEYQRARAEMLTAAELQRVVERAVDRSPDGAGAASEVAYLMVRDGFADPVWAQDIVSRAAKAGALTRVSPLSGYFEAASTPYAAYWLASNTSAPFSWALSVCVFYGETELVESLLQLEARDDEQFPSCGRNAG